LVALTGSQGGEANASTVENRTHPIFISLADTPISAIAAAVLVGVTAAAIAIPWEIDSLGVL
jgi:hypothetical protein